MWSPETLALVFAVFLLAGLTKGVVGFGLPTVALAFLVATLGLKAAMALMLIPAFATNVWQALAGGALAALLRRLWPLLLAVCIGVWLGTGVLATADANVLSGLFGLLLCLYAAISLATAQVPPPGRHERWLSPAVGAVNGFVTGLTGSFVVPGVLYLQALGLSRDALVQAMGVLFLVSTTALALALGGRDLLPADLGAMSAAALVPAFLGMALGQRLRARLPQQRFRQVFFAALLALGGYLAARAFL